MPVVQNMSPGPVVHQDTETDTTIEWGPKDDPHGMDIQEVPEAMLKKPHLARVVRAGTLRVVPADEVESLQEVAWSREEQTRKDSEVDLSEVLDAPNADRDIMQFECLVSGEPVFMSQGDARVKPPLAEKFQHLADEFIAIPDPTGKVDEQGREVITWTRMQMEAPEKETA